MRAANIKVRNLNKTETMLIFKAFRLDTLLKAAKRARELLGRSSPPDDATLDDLNILRDLDAAILLAQQPFPGGENETH